MRTLQQDTALLAGALTVRATAARILCLCLLVSACAGSDPVDTEIDDPDTSEQTQAIRRYGYRIVNVFPHDPLAWTQGLVFHNGVLYEGTGGGTQLSSHPELPPSGLRRVELETGRVLEQIGIAPRYFGEGIVLFGDRIRQLTWRSHVGFSYERDGFARIDSFTYATEGWGLTHDGQRLIMSDGSATITFRNPQSFAEVGSIDVTARTFVRVQTQTGVQTQVRTQPIGSLNELEYIDGEIWANVWQTDLIARIDPASGDVVGWVELGGLLTSRERTSAGVLNGIAYDAGTQRLFVTGKLWPWLFQIELVDAG